MKELTITATLDNIINVTSFIDSELEKNACPLKIQMQIDIAIDEIFSNIARYAYSPATGEATIRIEIIEQSSAVVITFIDQGIPYNPLEKEDPDITLSAEEREIGGLGIYMVKKSMDEISYEYKDKKNILKIKKNFN